MIQVANAMIWFSVAVFFGWRSIQILREEIRERRADKAKRERHRDAPIQIYYLDKYRPDARWSIAQIERSLAKDSTRPLPTESEAIDS